MPHISAAYLIAWWQYFSANCNLISGGIVINLIVCPTEIVNENNFMLSEYTLKAAFYHRVTRTPPGLILNCKDRNLGGFLGLGGLYPRFSGSPRWSL
jgi:hypothetical protein